MNGNQNQFINTIAGLPLSVVSILLLIDVGEVYQFNDFILGFIYASFLSLLVTMFFISFYFGSSNIESAIGRRVSLFMLLILAAFVPLIAADYIGVLSAGRQMLLMMVIVISMTGQYFWYTYIIRSSAPERLLQPAKIKDVQESMVWYNWIALSLVFLFNFVLIMD